MGLFIEIIVIIATISFVVWYIGSYIYKKKKNIPTGDCAYCQKKGIHKKNKLVSEYHKKYGCSCKHK